MRIRVLGSSPARPNPGAANTGYLLEAGEARYLIDCGSGVLGQLRRYLELGDLDAVFLSHAHPDHCLDLITLRQSLAYAPGPARKGRLPVYALPDAIACLRDLGAVFEPDGFWAPWIEWIPIGAGDSLEIDGLRIRFQATRHYRPCLAMRFERAGGCLVFTADGGPEEVLAEFARGADLLISEATLLDREDQPDAWGHMSAAETGRLAAAAAAGRLLLTHYYASYGAERLLSRAREACAVPVDLAQEGEVFDV